MEIRPDQQFLLFFYAFLSGVLLGGFYEVLRAFRILLGVMRVPARLHPLYAKKLPLLGKGIPAREGRGKRLRRGIVVAIGDFLFMVVAAVIAELLLYDYNSGEFRVFVPVLMAAGLALFRVSISRLCAMATPYVAYALAVAGAYFRALCLLPVRVAVLLWRLCLRPCRTLWFFTRQKLHQRKLGALCRRQLQFAATGFGYPGKEVEKNAQTKTNRQQKTDLSHPAVDYSDLSRGAGHRRGATDRVQPKTPGGRGARKRERKIRAKRAA